MESTVGGLGGMDRSMDRSVDWVVFDYGGVICRPPSPEAGRRLAGEVGVEPGEFWPAFWRRRADYDLGAVDAAAYWRDVFAQLGRHDAEVDVERLVALDLSAWLDLDAGTLEVVGMLAARGARLALLSNAPVEMARVIDGEGWSAAFRHRLYSADLRMAKPDPQIYHRMCAILGTRPGQVLFIDDRVENVDAAEGIGMRALLFQDAAKLWSELSLLLPASPAGPQ
ncbi:HAD family hydrolase [Actinomadura harenae]|uniref:HAD family phosphatase n=1 Tax=Actinomadura harenae TaxID=2483351 RepID=A0A3M2LWT5_9ACTN|nr:HAD family phosphatase [Actinomadura harenae]RMI41586.1 HAD family phosphatase [Actinomadura harenae]